MTIATVKDMVRNESVNIFASTVGSTAAFAASTGVSSPGTWIQSTSTSGGNYATFTVPPDDKYGILVSWASSVGAAVYSGGPKLTVAAGDGWRNSLGSYALTMMTATGNMRNTWILGPFESAQFSAVSASSDYAPVGDPYLTLTMTTSTSLEGDVNTCYVLPFKLPVVEYTT
jgi:hypothetical protein